MLGRRPADRPILIRAPTLLLVLALGACDAVERTLATATPRERYAERLRMAGLDSTAVTREWQAAATRAISAAPLISPPFEEAGYFASGRPDARGYRLRVRRGQRILATFGVTGSRSGILFADLFELADSAAPERIASADSGATTLDTEIARDGEVVLRLQPEVLSGGRYTVTIRLSATLGFPVRGVDPGAIRSRFGAERDAGRRSHEGVDIFAARGTTVVAAHGGRAVWVGTNELGGNVVMIRDRERGLGHYYAHLDSQLVSEGELVTRGQPIGFVGNTGNARTTPPHLHFGIYQRGRGAIDPSPFIVPPDSIAAPVRVDQALVGTWIRTSRAASLQAAPSGSDIRPLEPRTALQALGGSGRAYRVRLPDGMEGFVATDRVEAARPLGRVMSGRLREHPDTASVEVASATSASPADVIARYDAFDLVRIDGVEGWRER